MQEALKSFVEKVDPDNNKIIVLVVDQAGWHMSKELKTPSNLLIIPQPAYTPELSPVEPLVKKLKAPLCNRLIETMHDLKAILSEKCVRLNNNLEEVKSQTLFSWIAHVLVYLALWL